MLKEATADQPEADIAGTGADAGDAPRQSNGDRITAFLERPGRSAEVAQLLGVSLSRASTMLGRMVAAGRVRRLALGLYCTAIPGPAVPAVQQRQARLLAALDRPRTLADAAATAGLQFGAHAAMHALVRNGQAVRLGGGLHGKPADGPAQPLPGQMPLQAELLRAMQTPQSLRSLAAVFRVPIDSLASLLQRCEAQGLVVQAGYGCYVAAMAMRRLVQSSQAPRRPQPVRDAILAFLTRPRQAHEVAAHIGGTVPLATGHLKAMLKRNLVVRTGYGRYERADLVAADAVPATTERQSPVRETVLSCLDQPATIAAISRRCRMPASSTRSALTALVSSGRVVRVAPGWFIRAGTPHDGSLPLGSARSRPAQDAVLACLDQPQHVAAIAARCACTLQSARHTLGHLARRGLVVRIAPRCYARTGTPPGDALPLLAEQAADAERRRAVQNAVLALLGEPKTTADLAASTGRSGWATRRTLARLRAAGKVSRVAYGVHVRADLAHGFAGSPPPALPSPSQDAVLACLDRPLHLTEIAAMTGLTWSAARGALSRLVRRGKAQALGNHVYGPAA